MDDHLPLTATHWGTYRVEVEDGRVAALKDFEEDPDPSPIGPGIVSSLHSPSRITAPMVRESWLKDGPGARTDLRGKDPRHEQDMVKRYQSWAEATGVLDWSIALPRLLEAWQIETAEG